MTMSASQFQKSRFFIRSITMHLEAHHVGRPVTDLFNCDNH